VRAILIVQTTTELDLARKSDLKKIASGAGWLAVDQADEDRIRALVLDDVFEEHKFGVRDQWVCSLEKSTNLVVGIIGMNSEKRQIEIRLKGRETVTTGELKATCSEIVEMLIDSNRSAARVGGMNFGFTFKHHIQILAKGTREQKWDGEVNTQRAWAAARMQEPAQWTALIGFSLGTLLGMAMSFPPVATRLFPPQYLDYATGYVGRFASAALFGAVLAYLNLKLRVDDLRREGAITWSPA
jgi:hypothetical protein